jgi:hypothetical protein
VFFVSVYSRKNCSFLHPQSHLINRLPALRKEDVIKFFFGPSSLLKLRENGWASGRGSRERGRDKCPGSFFIVAVREKGTQPGEATKIVEVSIPSLCHHPPVPIALTQADTPQEASGRGSRERGRDKCPGSFFIVAVREKGEAAFLVTHLCSTRARVPSVHSFTPNRI